MTQAQIETIVHSLIPAEDIRGLDISINQYNNQVDRIWILFNVDTLHSYTDAGRIMDQLGTLTMDDEYGDITEIKLTATTLYEFKGTVTCSWTFDINIDS